MRSWISITSVPNGTHGLLLPAVLVAVSPLAEDPSESAQAGRLTSGVEVREYPLLTLGEWGDDEQR